MRRRADLRYERRLWRDGVEVVAGVDEAGVGPMAGPVVAAAVIFRPETFIRGVHDSKQLRREQREQLYPVIRDRAIAVGLGTADVSEIDRFNIYHATVLATMRAIESLSLIPQHVLVDGRRNPSLKIPQTAIVGGDRKSFCIAAASIIAKVERDRMMRDLDSLYPGYGFAAHKGYCTASHIAAVGRLGPSPVHRTSFFRVREALQIKLLL